MRGGEKRKRGCGEEKSLYFGATVDKGYFPGLVRGEVRMLFS